MVEPSTGNGSSLPSEIGFYGADLWAYVRAGSYGGVRFGSGGQDRIPDELIANLPHPKAPRRRGGSLPPADAAPVLASLSEVREGCLGTKNAKSEWDPVEVHDKQVVHRA